MNVSASFNTLAYAASANVNAAHGVRKNVVSETINGHIVQATAIAETFTRSHRELGTKVTFSVDGVRMARAKAVLLVEKSEGAL